MPKKPAQATSSYSSGSSSSSLFSSYFPSTSMKPTSPSYFPGSQSKKPGSSSSSSKKPGSSSSSYKTPSLVGGSPGSSSNKGLASVGVGYDPLGGGFYYVRAESIDGQELLDYQRSSSAAPAPYVNSLIAMDVPHVPVVRPSVQQGLMTQDEIRAQQQVIPGTMMEHWHGTTPNGPVTGASNIERRQDAPAPAPAPTRPAPGSPTLRIRRSRAGAGNAAFAAGSRNALDLGGFDPNPLSIRPQ